MAPAPMAPARSVFFVLVAAASAQPIVLNPLDSRQGDLKLMLLVPGGKVPPEDYLPMARGAQEQSQLYLSVGIPRCHINLCDPILELRGLLEDLIAAVNKTAGGVLRRADVFVTGHSLGGTGARHFYDIWPGSAGLALFGTQFNGDHEDFKGTLGYPTDLQAFPGPLLALTGELDMLPISHTAELVRQWQGLSKHGFSYQKLPIIVAGMDHSQFCPPFNVSGDLVPEISNEAAVGAVSEILAAWLDAVASRGAAATAVRLLHAYAEKTVPIAAPFIKATGLDGSWCASAQKLLAGSPEALHVIAEHRYDSVNLEHCHPNVTMDGGVLTATVCDYRFYASTNSTFPNFAPVYQGAQDISCKMVAEDKIAAALGQPAVDMGSPEVVNRCRLLNRRAFDVARGLVSQDWPRAVHRFEAQGKRVTFDEDSQALLGPQWVLSRLEFQETDREVKIASNAMISPLTSQFYPGSHYCKLLAPSKAVELLMTRGLTARYRGAPARPDGRPALAVLV
uniref:1-alkyl-2-acetylglycerophosphocholine esterase n=1 Tax=Pyrodinium bahamense TaxID=73915 RepID=A0A7S0FY25_9DINO